MVETPLPSRDADWYSPEDLRKISYAWASGRLFDREAIDREAATRQLTEALQWWGQRPSDSTFQMDEWADTVVDAALGEA